jgi:predicted metal-dependent peptidase
MPKISPERRLKKIVIGLMRDPLFADLSGIMMLGRKEVVDDIPTACTDGRDELYGRKFIEKLDDKSLAFVIVHEALHKAGRHLHTWEKLHKEDPQLANQAMDYWVNLTIINRDPIGDMVTMPKEGGKEIGLYDRRFANMNIKQIFDILKQESRMRGGIGRGDGGNEEGRAYGVGGFDEHDWEGAKSLSKEEVDELAKEVDQALRQGKIAAAKMHGKGAGSAHRDLDELLNPKVDWRQELREFVSATCAGRDFSSWRKPNRRFLSHDIIMPSLVSERVDRMVIGVDTSGSIGGPELTRFLSEVVAIAETVNPDKVDLIYWDAEVAGHEVYNSGTLATLVNSTKPKGGGGTNVSCLSNYLNKHAIKPECVVVFTDGYLGGDWGEWDVPVLWAIHDNNSTTAPVGKTIHVD